MYAFLFRLSGDEELVRERMCCAIALSLSLSFIHSLTRSLKTYTSSPCLEKGNANTLSKHENTKLPFEQKRQKMASYVSYVLVSNKRKKQKHCADWYITDTNQPSHISRSHGHSYTFTKIFTSITNPICLIFFFVFVISFLGKCKSSSFFIIHFSIALLFI